MKKAILAREAQAMMAHPTDEKSMENCDISTRAISDAKVMFGPNHPNIRSRMVRKKPRRVEIE